MKRSPIIVISQTIKGMVAPCTSVRWFFNTISEHEPWQLDKFHLSVIFLTSAKKPNWSLVMNTIVKFFIAAVL